MAGVSDRLRARIDRDFPSRAAPERWRGWSPERATPNGSRRPSSCWPVVISTGSAPLSLTAEDWRDTLCAAGLEHEDWPDQVDAELGPVR